MLSKFIENETDVYTKRHGVKVGPGPQDPRPRDAGTPL